jgi:hypothetical protein
MFPSDHFFPFTDQSCLIDFVALLLNVGALVVGRNCPQYYCKCFANILALNLLNVFTVSTTIYYARKSNQPHSSSLRHIPSHSSDSIRSPHILPYYYHLDSHIISLYHLISSASSFALICYRYHTSRLLVHSSFLLSFYLVCNICHLCFFMTVKFFLSEFFCFFPIFFWIFLVRSEASSG